jgi:hypothetical protein
MAKKSPTQHHNHWGSFPNPASLPNVSGSLTQDGALEAGDTVYSVSDSTLYVCTVPTLNAGVWGSTGGGGAPAPLTGTGNPNTGAVPGLFGQEFYDTDGGIWYRCISNPSGTSWVVT